MSYSQIDTLIRYFAHDDENDDDDMWIVSCGGLEGSKRHYRVFYGTYNYELTIDVDNLDKDELSDFVSKLFVIMSGTIACPGAFIKSVRTLIDIDPWLQGAFITVSVDP
jgi:hypothetical protein